VISIFVGFAVSSLRGLHHWLILFSRSLLRSVLSTVVMSCFRTKLKGIFHGITFGVCILFELARD